MSKFEEGFSNSIILNGDEVGALLKMVKKEVFKVKKIEEDRFTVKGSEEYEPIGWTFKRREEKGGVLFKRYGKIHMIVGDRM